MMSKQYVSKSRSGLWFEFLLITGFSLAPMLALGDAMVTEDPDSISLPDASRCLVYAVHDGGLNNSQIISFDPANDYQIAALGPEHSGCDLEAMDMDNSDPNELYVASGDDVTNENCKPGEIYRVDLLTGALEDIGPTGYAEVDGISFNPNTNELWGWAQDTGLFVVPRKDDDFYGPLDVSQTGLVFPTCGEFEDLAWNEDGTRLCAVQNNHGPSPHPCPYYYDDATFRPDPEKDPGRGQTLWCYDISSGDLTTVCDEQIQQLVSENCAEIEAIDGPPEGSEMPDTLIIGYHNCNKLPVFATLNTATCELTEPEESETSYEGILVGKPDIEGITFPCPELPTPSCLPTWQYVKDSFLDSTAVDPSMVGASPVAVGGTDFEIYGMAIKNEEDSVVIAINANLSLNGSDVDTSNLPPGWVDDNINWGDLMLDFDDDGSPEYAVHFAAENDAGVTELGLYQDITPKDVTIKNFGWVTIEKYNDKVMGEIGESISFGDVESWDGGYFDTSIERSQNMVINTGTKVTDDGFESLDATALAAMELDFVDGLDVSDANELGDYTFGFKFNKTADMKDGIDDDFIAYIFSECLNDGLAINAVQQCP